MTDKRFAEFWKFPLLGYFGFKAFRNSWAFPAYLKSIKLAYSVFKDNFSSGKICRLPMKNPLESSSKFRKHYFRN